MFVWYHDLLFIIQYFRTICGFHICHSIQFFLFFLVPKLTKPNKKKKKHPEHEERTSER